MKTIVNHIDGFRYIKFQPGDGTIYTAMYGQVKGDNFYIALGAGDNTRGGYFYRKSSAEHMIIDLVKWIEDGKSPMGFTHDYHLFHHAASKTNVFMESRAIDWTVIATVLFAAIVTLADPSNGESYGLIPAVYHNDSGAIIKWAEEWGIVV